MNISKVYIRGAYGPGNLGDDILMLSVINILKMRFKESDIMVGVDHPETAKNFNPNIKWLHIKQPVRADLVVLGGGGQFFSFVPPAAQPTTPASGFEKLRRSIRAQTSIASTLTRLYVGLRGGIDKIYFHRRLAAFCIGLGPFDGGGKQLARASSIIGRCDYISVRDATSKTHCMTFGKPDTRVYTDPSLLRQLWTAPEGVDLKGDSQPDYVSFILRDWPHDANGQAFIAAMVRTAKTCAERGEKIRFVSLYQERDQHLIDQYADFEWLCWNAADSTPEIFMRRLILESDVIISARAHGVLLPAALGYPTIAVEIENKLRKVHEMLPLGTKLVSAPDSTVMLDAIQELRRDKALMTEHVKREVSERAELAKQSVDDFLHWVDHS